MNSSKRNADKIVDALISQTRCPFKVNEAMAKITNSNKDFNKVLILRNKKAVQTIELEGLPIGVLNVYV